MPDVYFAIPGDLATLTGGYIYVRRLMEHLPAAGWRTLVVRLPASYPHPTPPDLAATRAALAALPPGALVLIDGLAFGAMPPAVLDGLDLRLVALVHHPLALESGLTAESADTLRTSERAALKLARHVIVTSPRTAKTLISAYDVPTARITVAMPGTDAAARAAPTAEATRLLTVATLTPRKAHEVLIAALARIQDVAWTASLVGSIDRDPATTGRIRALIADLGLGSRVTLHGELSGIALDAEYVRATLFVLPSRHEGYGMAFAEALARGLPIVACAAGAVTDTVPADAGILVPPDDPVVLSGALRRLLCEPDLRARMADAAWQYGQALPRWPETARRAASAFESLA